MTAGINTNKITFWKTLHFSRYFTVQHSDECFSFDCINNLLIPSVIANNRVLCAIIPHELHSMLSKSV